MVRTMRWAILLRGFGLRIGYAPLLWLNYGGTFFNTFLPTGFGGDFVKMAESAGLWREKRELAAGIVLLDRFSGLSALFILCLVSLLFADGLLPLPVERLLLFVAVAGTILTLGILLFRPAARILHPVIGRIAGPARAEMLQQISSEFSASHFLVAGLVSAGFHLLMIVIHYILNRALGASLPILLFGIFTPIVSLTLLLPSIQGLGLRENLYGFLVQAAGYSESLGVSIGLLVYSLTFLTGILGGLIYLVLGVNRAIRPIPVEPEGRLP